VKLLEPTLDCIVVKRPKRGRAGKQHLCADKGYAGRPAQRAMEARHYIPHVRQRGEEVKTKLRKPGYRPRRWVVERTHAWVSRFRKLLVRFEKLAMSHEGLLELACALMVFQKIII
jgi:putative transposase